METAVPAFRANRWVMTKAAAWVADGTLMLSPTPVKSSCTLSMTTLTAPVPLGGAMRMPLMLDDAEVLEIETRANPELTLRETPEPKLLITQSAMVRPLPELNRMPLVAPRPSTLRPRK